MSNIAATLDEAAINRIFAQTVIKGSLTREVKDPIFATKLVTVTLNYEAKEFRAHVQEGGIRFTAKVHAASGVFTYEDAVEGSMSAAVEGRNVILAVGAFVISLYVKIAGKRVDIANVDVAQKLPPELRRVSLNVLPNDLVVPLPDGGSVTLKITNPKVVLRPGNMVVSAELT